MKNFDSDKPEKTSKIRRGIDVFIYIFDIVINVVNKSPFSRKQRPFGVWVLTIHALIFALFIFEISSSIMVLKGEVAMFASAQVPAMLRWAYLIIGLIIASILAWTGWELGRKLFLFLISVFYLGMAIGLYFRITHPYFGKNPMDYKIDSWLHFLAYILIPMLYVWYFNRPSTKEFYEKAGKVFIK